MDRHSNTDKEQGPEQKIDKKQLEEDYINEDGALFRVPYRMIKKVTFSGLKKSDLIDQPHAARLQYRLLLHDEIIKAYVDHRDQSIMIIFNPKGADNLRKKSSLEDIIALLAGEGIHIDKTKMNETDFDYYKELYSRMFNPVSVRENPPYGFSLYEWRGMKPKWKLKRELEEKKKLEKFRAWQKNYAKN